MSLITINTAHGPVTVDPNGTWTRFMDMNSGGGHKEAFAFLYIQAPEDEAKRVFYARFGHNPERVSCTCCGEDYSISEEGDLAQATAYQRNCRYDEETRQYVEEQEPRWTTPRRRWVSLKEYLQHDDVAVITADEITEAERHTKVPNQGYMWVG